MVMTLLVELRITYLFPCLDLKIEVGLNDFIQAKICLAFWVTLLDPSTTYNSLITNRGDSKFQSQD